MVDLETVCCMCGDVGFPDKLFRCNKCRNRFQHSDQERSTTRHGSSSKKSSMAAAEGVETGGVSSRSEYSGDHKIKQHDHNQESGSGEKVNTKNHPSGGVPSPRTATRRYKLLKDVMC
ncbi:unnamed protein product [Malus baccata var. baccata]